MSKTQKQFFKDYFYLEYGDTSATPFIITLYQNDSNTFQIPTNPVYFDNAYISGGSTIIPNKKPIPETGVTYYNYILSSIQYYYPSYSSASSSSNLQSIDINYYETEDVLEYIEAIKHGPDPGPKIEDVDSPKGSNTKAAGGSNNSISDPTLHTVTVTTGLDNINFGNLKQGELSTLLYSYIGRSATNDLVFVPFYQDTARLSTVFTNNDPRFNDGGLVYHDPDENGYNSLINGNNNVNAGYLSFINGESNGINGTGPVEYCFINGVGNTITKQDQSGNNTSQNFITGSGNVLINTYNCNIEGYQNQFKDCGYIHAEGELNNNYQFWYDDSSNTCIYNHLEGYSNQTRGSYNHLEGYNNLDYDYDTNKVGQYAHVEGYYSKSIGSATHAEGYRSIAEGNYSHAEGYNSVAQGEYSHAEGYSTAYGEYSHAEGNSIAYDDYAHAEGDSTAANGPRSHAEGGSTYAGGCASHAEGKSTQANGHISHAEGNETQANGNSSHAEGNETNAYDDFSHAEGDSTYAGGSAAHAEGYETYTNGFATHAEGYNTRATNNISHAQGHFNADMTTGGEYYNTDGTAFVIGNGTSSDAKSNAFSVQFNGVTKASNTITASTTADYAEFFEWKDSNPLAEDRVGHFIAMDGDKIKIASPEDDYILGVVSGAPFVLGNGDCDVWNGMYLRDPFGRYIDEPAPQHRINWWDNDHEQEYVYDEDTDEQIFIGTRHKLNPEYDPTRPYVSRFDRPEWAPVGMLGVLAVIDDGTCQVNGYCKVAEGGIATASIKGENTWRVIKRVNENVVQIIFK